MAQQPAVVIIARHGPRLDAADQSWHLSTPTPYDPPLTYGGWNQSRALGVRIASLLHAREQAVNENVSDWDLDGVTIHDFARQDGAGQTNTRKRKRRHKVVIHSSPFLRCLQTSVAIAAGMAQFQAPSDGGSRPGTSAKSRTPSSMHSASPRVRAMDGVGSPNLAPISEPKHDLAHTVARRVLYEHKRHRKAKMRVDAFLGEWLNPSYFDHITPPPPSAMMVATAKAELMHNEPVDIFTPTISAKASNSSLWAGSNKQQQEPRESTVDDFSDVQDALPAPSPRSRSNSLSSVASTEGSIGRRSPRPSHAVQRHHSTLPKPETTVYVPPIPQYAVSASDYIPRGYVAHARQACVNVDYQWDSSRPPQAWEDGGEYGEEWSDMHKRFRRGLNHLIHWYSQHDADDRAEDSLSFEQAEKHDEEEQEELVLVLVTHGAGSNALIGALTGQPVLLDVGMASLTMAVRRDDAPHITTYASSTAPSAMPSPSNTPSLEQMYNHARRGSLDLGLSSIYEMKLVSSSEHLRPGADPTKVPATNSTSRKSSGGAAQYTQRYGPSTNGTGIDSNWSIGEPARGSTSKALGSVLRPQTAVNNPTSHAVGPGNMARSNTTSAVPQISVAADEAQEAPTPTFSSPPTGLWTPPTSRTPQLQAETMSKERASAFDKLNDASGGRVSPGRDLVLDFSTSPPDSRPSSSGGPRPVPTPEAFTANATAVALNGNSRGGLDGASDESPSADHEQNQTSDAKLSEKRDSISALPAVAEMPPLALSRSLSQKGLWGTRPHGVKVARRFGVEPKRRWSVHQQDDGPAH